MKSFAVIGLGKFGHEMALNLLNQDVVLIAIDKNEASAKKIKSEIENVFIFDATDAVALKQAGISDVDAAIISTGEDIEASILCVMALQEIGVKTIIAKASSGAHGQILSKLGVNRVIYPLRDAAKNLALNLLGHQNCVIIDVTTTLKVARIKATAKLNNIRISEINEKMGSSINIIAYKKDNTWDRNPIEQILIHTDDEILVMGEQKDVSEFIKVYG
ncbi:potassium channel family protein [Campylobacter geochelonis]|uniref:TRK system potassium uptake protein TrkA n=1 Tax=Campylobacter geochelonis TaxID=1780362 RepID=A0A128EF17_9BACT|nr:TrkA family potassium uptake protein [Campylobacter geochelonis]QKF71785.1 potassium transporter KtrAB, KtrA subunit [Campylobacter geochelonis]CZE47514.1 TRK system potassium uptake protein TrkA [Campylobacter geochelonis]CZE48447.1 TRK system potassium uptake protein TrkA [Campylobacter geochelonis]